MTVLEAIQKSTEYLARKGVESPRLQSELLLAQVLKTERLKLYLEFNRELAPGQADALRELVKRRGNREPLQHIAGSTSFCGLEIAVNPRVLIPRPETELLAEEGWRFLDSLNRPASFLDFGTGSGCIAVALCHFARQCHGWALDTSGAALEVARQNAERHGVAGRIRFIQSEGFSGLPPGSRFDLIISNPPYIPSGEIATLEIEVRDHEPREALDGGPDGLDFYRLIARQARSLLAPEGKLLLELGENQDQKVSNLLADQGWSVEKVVKDLSSRPRILKARGPASN